MYQLRKPAKVVTNLSSLQMSDAEAVVWPGFRILKPLRTGAAATATRTKRKTNALSNPPFDFHLDTLFDYPTIVAHKLADADWTKYNRHVTLQVADCPFACWHCYNDARRDNPEVQIQSQEVEATQVMERFRNQQQRDSSVGKQSNVLRISGGEPFLEADFVLECLRIAYEEQENGSPKMCIWTETNIYPFVAAPRDGGIGEVDTYIEEMAKYADLFVLHPCFHGIDEGQW